MKVWTMAKEIKEAIPNPPAQFLGELHWVEGADNEAEALGYLYGALAYVANRETPVPVDAYADIARHCISTWPGEYTIPAQPSWQNLFAFLGDALES